MGDKTQLLAMLLAIKFKRPIPIILGIFVSTLVNHAWDGSVDEWVARAMGREVPRWVIGVSFLVMALWILVLDELDTDGDESGNRFGVFGTPVIVFFLAQMADKTQIATVALAARYDALFAVVAETTLGMMLANVRAVFLGDKIAKKLSMPLVHAAGAALFAALGPLTLFNAGKWL
jgi:putative Ca2+/H+ antiporter (TMEM165/GDT1 family)